MDDKLPESFFDSLLPEQDEPLRAADGAASSRLRSLERLIEQGPEAVLCLDPQLRCHLANRAARHWFPAALQHDLAANPQTLHSILPAPLVDALVPYLSAALRGTRMRLDETAQHPELGQRKLSIQVQPDFEHQRVAGVFLYVQDTTERQQGHPLREHHRQTSAASWRPDLENHLRLLVDGLRDAAIFFLDASGRISDWTPSAERLMGYGAADMLGQPLERLTPVNTPEQGSRDPHDLMAIALERAALLGQSETPGWQRRPDGTLFWAHTLLTALNDTESGQALGYACLMRDMTENKRLVDMLQELNAALETRVDERTRQLQDINRDLEAFSSSISHDLRSPLRHIGSFVQMLREDLGEQGTPGVRSQLDTIAQAADHMGQMIEGLLAFSRLGRARLRCRTVAMADLLHSSLNRVQHDPALNRPASQVQWELPTELPLVDGDGLLLSQVWDNLLANALKYSRPRQPARIAIGWRRDDVEQENVFWVQDNGVGFNPQRADHLFGMFQRLHRASEFEGTGIGLALCRRIVERHGGRIWAESEPQVGSTFYFALPARTVDGSSWARG